MYSDPFPIFLDDSKPLAEALAEARKIYFDGLRAHTENIISKTQQWIETYEAYYHCQKDERKVKEADLEAALDAVSMAEVAMQLHFQKTMACVAIGRVITPKPGSLLQAPSLKGNSLNNQKFQDECFGCGDSFEYTLKDIDSEGHVICPECFGRWFACDFCRNWRGKNQVECSEGSFENCSLFIGKAIQNFLSYPPLKFQKNVYFAGPDVLKKYYCRRKDKIKTLCLDLDLYPLMPGDFQLDSPQAIYRFNCDMIDRADAVVANLNPFRGLIEPDSRTVFECAYAVAKGKPVIGYLRDRRDMLTKLRQMEIGPPPDGTVCPDGTWVEDFGLPLNLMLAKSLTAIAGSLKEATELAVSYIKL